MPETRIYSKDGSEAIARCDGPTWTGACPRVETGLPVMCAGRLLATAGPEGVLGLMLLVDPDAKVCPLAALGFLFTGDATSHRSSQETQEERTT
jgi:hypothetical protein